MHRWLTIAALLAVPGCGDFVLDTPDMPLMTPQAIGYYDTIDILGIGPAYEAKLKAQGIKRVNQLLQALATRRQRAELAELTGISGKLLLRWANHADLMRVTGVGPRFARLLEKAGVDTVVELSHRQPGQLASMLAATNEVFHLVDRVPGEATISHWIGNSRSRDRMLEY